ncbi:DUF6796 family protein [Dyella soli]|uniref:DUF4386 family protein n=1 Tax=Dyella soli TaxID=522319 RepID=A0A4R0YQQ2_9GAMM|nr:DUF6796 family protein [Dyella soli]TCI08795.1 hypothetical protein EZM97_21300 [Dyella soli]
MKSSAHKMWAGVLGAIGAFALFLGDQGLYFAPVSGADFQAHLRDIVVAAPTGRVLLGAGIGPMCTLLLLFGFWHVYLNIRDRQSRLAAAVAVVMALVYLYGGSYHVFWAAKALTMKAVDSGVAATPALTQLYEQVRDFGRQIYLVAEISAYLSLMALLVLIALGRTAYPRWVALLTPAVPILLIQTFATSIPAPLGSIVVGGSINLAFFLFFVVSIITTRQVATASQGSPAMATKPAA